MLSVRSLARSAPRTLSCLRQSVVARPVVTAAMTVSSRSAVAASRIGMLRSAAAASFSTTARRSADSEVDAELTAKIDSEMQIEEEMKANEQVPSSVKDFLENSPFKLIDTPGQEVVKMVREFGAEKITVTFSIGDVSEFDPYADDPAAFRGEEEAGAADDDMQLSPPKSSNGKRGQSDSERSVEEEMEDEDAALEDTPASINLSIVIEKPGRSSGALCIDANTQDGNIIVDNLHYYDDAKVAFVETPEAGQKRADLYLGPPFGSLDEDLQVLIERFLDDRGVNQALAVFVPDYVSVKEQKEYMQWLRNVKGFVNA